MQHKFGIYQVLVRHFGLPASPAEPNGSRDTNGCGTFADLSDAALRAIAGLGMDAIWLTGILRHATQTPYSFPGFLAVHPATVKGKAGSPYAITDFFELDPDLASRPEKRWIEFESLLKRIRKAGLRVIIDFVPNHTARQYRSEQGRSLGLPDPGSTDVADTFFRPENFYYYFPGQTLQFPDPRTDHLGKTYHEFPARATGNDCFSAKPAQTDWYETVKLNYGCSYGHGESVFHPGLPTWQYMKEVLRFWAAKGVDGFRCDMAEMVPAEFWEWVLAEIRREFPDLIFLAEIYNPSLYPTFLNRCRFDYLYDKVGLYDAARALVTGKGNSREITRVWQSQEGMQSRMLRFMENHDEQRMASVQVAGNAFHALPAMALAALMGPGPFMVYAGQELGETGDGEAGFSGDDGKTSIFDYFPVSSLEMWRETGFRENKLPGAVRKLRAAYRNLFDAARSYRAFSEGRFYDLQYANASNPAYPHSKMFAFLRHAGEEIFLVICSFLTGRHWIRLIVPPEAWQALAVENPLPLRWKREAGEGDPELQFYLKASYDGDGGSPGVLIRMEEFGYAAYRLENPVHGK